MISLKKNQENLRLNGGVLFIHIVVFKFLRS